MMRKPAMRTQLSTSVILCASLWAAPALGDTVTSESQPLGSALTIIARQTKSNILFDPAMMTGLRAPEVKGSMSPLEAVQRALTGTRLEVVERGNRSFVVRARQAVEAEQRRPATLLVSSPQPPV